ncbi:MAG TPA: homocysteine S-methyltransferase family protein [Chthoniobacterales bacterium]
MIASRQTLPQLSGDLFLTDGGMETTLIFHEGIDLPLFAGFTLLATSEGRAALRKYYRTYAGLARRHGVGFVLESPTWRANPDWGAQLGYTPETLAEANRQGIGLMHEVREEFETAATPIVVSGCVGPRGDGYAPSALMNADEAARYHTAQVRTLRDAGADLVSAFTMNYIEEAVGIARAAEALDIPAVISFTLETDGRLPGGLTLREAIETVDAATSAPPAYYMINCAHPVHFEAALTAGEPWLRRIRGIRANSSMRSHAELNDAPDLDEGDPADLGCRHRDLLRKMPHVTVLGGCCGTDHRHVEAILLACRRASADG